MLRKDISDEYIRLHGAEVPELGYVLCIYSAEPGDAWRGHIAARAGWNGGGFLPDVPSLSAADALDRWVGKNQKPAPVV